MTPTRVADATDPDSWPSTLKYQFIVYSKDAKTEIANSGLIKKNSWTVPVSTLVWGENYYWTVLIYDGAANNSTYRTKHLLSTPVPQPPITANLSQNSEQGFDPTVGNYTTSARDAIISTVTNNALSSSYRYANSIMQPRLIGFGAQVRW